MVLIAYKKSKIRGINCVQKIENLTKIELLCAKITPVFRKIWVYLLRTKNRVVDLLMNYCTQKNKGVFLKKGRKLLKKA